MLRNVGRHTKVKVGQKTVRFSRKARYLGVTGGILAVLALGPALAGVFAAAPASAAVITPIQDSQTFFCLDSNYSNPDYPANGAVYTDLCNGGPYQQWSLASIPDTQAITITDVQTGLCLESNFPSPQTPNDGAVFTEGCTGGTAQEWAVDKAPNDAIGLCDVYTGLCLDSNFSNPDSPSTGAVYTDPGNGDTYQSWFVNNGIT